MKYKGSMLFSISAVIILILSCVNNIYSFGFTSEQKDIMNLQTFVMSDFGDEIDQSNNIVWVAKFSRYAKPMDMTKQRSEPDTNACYVEYFDTRPLGLPQQVESKQKWCLGVKAQYIKKGYNWIEMYPVVLNGGILNKDNKPVSTIEKSIDKMAYDDLGGKLSNQVNDQKTNLNLIGVVKSLDLWVWGGNYAWWLEFYLLDYKGFLHRLPAGDIRYVGWMNLRTRIPDYIPQAEHHVPFLKNLRLVMMKLWCYPIERVDQFYCYFDYMQVQTDVYRQRFNGDDLADKKW